MTNLTYVTIVYLSELEITVLFSFHNYKVYIKKLFKAVYSASIFLKIKLDWCFASIILTCTCIIFFCVFWNIQFYFLFNLNRHFFLYIIHIFIYFFFSLSFIKRNNQTTFYCSLKIRPRYEVLI